MKKISKIFVMILISIALAGNLYAADTSDAQDASEKFIKKASTSSLFEIESSKVALDKSRNPQIKKLADKLIKDHTTSNKKLKDVLTNEKLRFPMNMTLDEKNAKKIDELKETSERKFDKEYIDMQKQGHEETIESFKDFLDAKDTHPALRKFAEQTLPDLETHLLKISDIEKSL